MIDVHLFDEDGTWIVAAAGSEHRFDSRPDAFRAAKAQARALTPSRIVKGAPAVRAAAPAAPPPASPGPGAAPDDDPALARLGPRARAALERGRAADASGTGDAPPPVWDGDDGTDDEPPAGPTTTSAAPRRNDPPSRTRPATAPDLLGDDRFGDRYEDEPAPRPAGWEPWGDEDLDGDWSRLAGPAELGRSLLVADADEAPEPWAGCPEIRLSPAALDDPAVLTEVRRCFLTRTPVVYRLDDPHAVADPTVVTTEVWRIPVDVDLGREAVWQLALANAVDGRDRARPSWPLARAARDAGALRGAVGDVALADGQVALCDGGPLHFWPDGRLRLADGTEAVVVPRVTIDAGRLDPIGAAPPTADLAPDQLASVGDDAARSRIVAPAGSGKTRVLTERARYLIRSQHVPARSVCLVAFNKRAQEEMRDRTRDLPGLQVQTLNALSLSILNGGGTFLSRPDRVTTIDELEVRRLLSELVSFPRRANTDPAAAWLDALSMVRLGLRDPADVEAELNGDVDGFAAFFDDYRRHLRNRGAVDFDDQIYQAIEVLLREPAARAAAQASCRILLVDEFQDLTPAHLLLIRLLAGPEANVFGVGDDDQTIYGYSGARPDWLIEFDRYFPGATHHALEVNYRCPVDVVAAATNLLSHNRRRVPKEIRPGPHAATGDTVVVVRHAQPVVATAERVTDLVRSGTPPDDIAVLARVNTLLAPVQVALHEAGIPVHNREGGRFLERTGVAAVLSWLRLATGTRGLSGADVDRAARRPGRSLSPRLIEWMSEQRDVEGLRRLANRVQDKDRTKVEGFAADVERIRALAATARTDRLIEFVRSDIGLDRAMQTLDSAHRGRNSAAHSDDLRALIALGALHPDPGGFEAWLRAALDGGRDDGGVQLSTVHRVKGLEWPHVIVHDASAGSFPHRLSTDIEEERRVFHVALTRGQADVAIVADREIPSMFLDELAAPAPPVSERELAEQRAGGFATAASGVRPGGRRAAQDVDLVAQVGLEVEWGGYRCQVAEIEPTAVVLTAGRARFTVAFGSVVHVGGRERHLVAAPPSSAAAKGPRPPMDASGEAAFAALRRWRAERARTDGVPAFVVASDATIAEIASVRPTSPEALLGISGIGPTKLERYGDEILGVLDEVTP